MHVLKEILVNLVANLIWSLAALLFVRLMNLKKIYLSSNRVHLFKKNSGVQLESHYRSWCELGFLKI
jgi:hypothetical protein